MTTCFSTYSLSGVLRSVSLLSVALWGILATSCKREMFDAEAYQTLLSETAPIGNIDSSHDWNLTKSYTVSVAADSPLPLSVKTVCVLNGNPIQSTTTEILAEATATKGEEQSLFFYAPTCQKTFYAAIVTTDGDYLLKEFSAGEEKISFAAADGQPQTPAKAPQYQTYTYCYDSEYPKPSDDWDFNDLVLRIQKLPSQNAGELRLQISLSAVGCIVQMGAAVRLLGINHSDVESVSTEDGRTFDGTFDQMGIKRVFIEESSLLLRGRNGEAVLNLFEDAHWVMSPRIMTNGQGVVRMLYNTKREVDGTSSLQLMPKTLTYVVKLRDAKLLEKFTLENLDPFAIEDFNSGKWEIHDYAHKADGVLHDYGNNETATSNNMVWALKIPSGTFRYPVETVNMGFFKDGILTGAYMQNNHSFGQWVENHNSSIDWFLYPSTGLVY